MFNIFDKISWRNHQIDCRTIEWEMIVVCNKCSNTVITKNRDIIRYFSLPKPSEEK